MGICGQVVFVAIKDSIYDKVRPLPPPPPHSRALLPRPATASLPAAGPRLGCLGLRAAPLLRSTPAAPVPTPAQPGQPMRERARACSLIAPPPST